MGNFAESFVIDDIAAIFVKYTNTIGQLKTQNMAQFQPDLPSWIPSEVSTGTTLCAVEFKDGVVLGADTRTSMGSWVANRVTDKLTPISDNIMACRSGSAADTQAMTDVVRNQLQWHSVEFGAPPNVHTAAHLFKNISYQYRDQLTAGIIVAGWDAEKGGQVYSVPIGGALVRQKASIGGSGSTFLYGFLDANYREDMTKDQTVELVKQCITLAVNTKDGIERKLFLNNELNCFGNLVEMPKVKA